MPLCKDVRALRTGVRGTYVDPYMSMRLPRTQRGKGKEKREEEQKQKQKQKTKHEERRSKRSANG